MDLLAVGPIVRPQAGAATLAVAGRKRLTRLGVLTGLVLAACLAGCLGSPGSGSSSTAATPAAPSTLANRGPSPGGSSPVPRQDCPGHWHVTFFVVVEGVRVNFTHESFTLEGNPRMPIATHLHQGRDYEMHYEPQPSRCIPLRSAMDVAGVRWSPTSLLLYGPGHEQTPLAGTGHAQAGAYNATAPTADSPGSALHFFVQHADGPWAEVPVRQATSSQPQDGDRILILFGAYSASDVEAWESQVPLSPTYARTHPVP